MQLGSVLPANTASDPVMMMAPTSDSLSNICRAESSWSIRGCERALRALGRFRRMTATESTRAMRMSSDMMSLSAFGASEHFPLLSWPLRSQRQLMWRLLPPFGNGFLRLVHRLLTPLADRRLTRPQSASLLHPSATVVALLPCRNSLGMASTAAYG